MTVLLAHFAGAAVIATAVLAFPELRRLHRRAVQRRQHLEQDIDPDDRLL